MEQLLIEVDTPQDKELLLALLPRLNARVVDRQDIDKKKNDFLKLMEEIASGGGVGASFGDPSEWQREIRSWDRVLDGREE
ncbi:hypothetical protein EXU85_17685 [Spirosoma sp. KCTC 42546]|uniref:hypothetical protein n=1 Tax=Spirosoma sp. KCTC 42546 TaxID=2520506 RepID=UPI0011596A87|nr:hypothetical protein [Spirosoma sp. KCTC 42546]QDK80334.1 hypothetical protein EXU85_17685 [Spirosoma sp. KCTC 42546]